MNETLRNAPALFETVRAGDPLKTESNKPTTHMSTTTQQQPTPITRTKLASFSKKDEHRAALRTVLFHSVQDNEAVERRIILEREITDRHQMVVIDLNGAANKIYKEISNGPLSQPQEQRLRLIRHSKSVKITTPATQQNTPLSSVSTILQSLSEAEKGELRAILHSDATLAKSLVDVYKEEMERKKLSNFGSSIPQGISNTGHKQQAPNSLQNESGDGKDKRSLIVQSMIASMQNVLPVEMLVQLSSESNPTTTQIQPQHSKHNSIAKGSAFNPPQSGVNQEPPNLLLYAPTRAPVTSAKQIADSVYALYKTFCDFYKRLRETEAQYLTLKVGKMAAGSRAASKTASIGSPASNPETASTVPIEMVTPSSVILVSFFTRLFNLEDPLARSNYLDALLHNTLDGTGEGHEGEPDFVVKNEFYQLPRMDRMSEFSKNILGESGGGHPGHLDELFAAATELGTLLIDEAMQVVTEYPTPSLAYYAFGPLGAYMREQEREAQDAILEKQIRERAENELIQQNLLLSNTSGGNTFNDRTLILAPERKKKSEVSLLIPSSPYIASPITSNNLNQTYSNSVGDASVSPLASAKPSAGVAYPCSLWAADALPYTAFTSYVRTIAGALYPDRSNIVSSQLLAMTLLRRVHVLLL